MNHCLQNESASLTLVEQLCDYYVEMHEELKASKSDISVRTPTKYSHFHYMASSSMSNSRTYGIVARRWQTYYMVELLSSINLKILELPHFA